MTPPSLQAACQLGILGADLRVAGGGRAVSPSEPRRDPEIGLCEFLRSLIRTQGRMQAPFASEAHRLVTELQENGEATADGIDDATNECAVALATLNRSLDELMSSVSPAHQASVASGAGALRVGGSWVQGQTSSRGTSQPLLRKVNTATSSTGLHGAVALGMLGAILGLPRDAVLDAFAYSSIRGAVNAATRLNLIGPQRAVAVQTGLAPVAIEISDSSQSLGLHEAAGVAPILDTIHCAHDSLELRLFRT